METEYRPVYRSKNPPELTDEQMDEMSENLHRDSQKAIPLKGNKGEQNASFNQ